MNVEQRRMLDIMHSFKNIGIEALVPELNRGEMHLMHTLKTCGLGCDPEEGVRVADLVSCSPVPASAVSRVLGRLEDRGYIERRMDKEDRRSVRVFITEEGRAVDRKADERVRSYLDAIFERMGSEEMHELNRHLEMVLKIAKEELEARIK
ncbi:MAG: MarR family winged helix-turn-helix transcriptional regulator [Anaerovoracaceae bacterium]|jgi:DNA-binding MarR family transcriptional regulator